MKIYVKIAFLNVNNVKKKLVFIAQKIVAYAKKNIVPNAL
jgi:hypothetical protein